MDMDRKAPPRAAPTCHRGGGNGYTLENVTGVVAAASLSFANTTPALSRAKVITRFKLLTANLPFSTCAKAAPAGRANAACPASLKPYGSDRRIVING